MITYVISILQLFFFLIPRVSARESDSWEARVAQVTLANANKFYGNVQVLFDVSLTAEDGEFVVFVGPSGCGKSTLLRIIAGLEDISGGAVGIGDRDVTQVPPSDRGVAMVFQSYALYPHMTARANMEFGLKVNGLSPPEIAARVAEAARILQLEDYLNRKPGQLSGGQRQRVAIGRAIVKQPNVFLFDEPLSNLDAALRIQMRVELEHLHKTLGATMIYVTHDQVEAMTMADKIVVLNDGRIEQIGRPLELYHTPKTKFVAGFIGAPSMNFLPVSIDGGNGGSAEIRYGADTRVTIPDLQTSGLQGEDLLLGIRPEHLTLDTDGIRAQVFVVEALGGESYVHADTQAGHRLVIKAGGDVTVRRGEQIAIGLDPRRCHLFEASGAAVPRLPA